MAEIISWIATIATVIAASMTAANLGSRITGYGFCVFLVGSLSWLVASLLTDQPALMWTNVVLTALNIFGIWRWLGRQVRLEEGASVAAEASRQRPVESLFPVSLLLKSSLEDGRGNVLGSCVDAMAGCSSGEMRYVVMSEGGVAGVGERLRRIPWQQLRMDSDRLISSVARIESFAEIEKDEWPAR
jgi:hypothetical protein